MEKQLKLLDVPQDWQLDAETREIGRQGILAAREALEQAHRVARSTAEPKAA